LISDQKNGIVDDDEIKIIFNHQQLNQVVTLV